MRTLRLEDLSDREVLLVIRDLAQEDPDGWVLAYDVGIKLGIEEEYAKRAAAQRMSWLRRFGALEREVKTDHKGDIAYDPKGNPRWGQRWKLTDVGEIIAAGALRATQRNAMQSLSDGQLLLVTREVVRRVRRADTFTSAKLAEREWRYGWMTGDGQPRTR